MRKILALMLCLILAFSLAVPSFAADAEKSGTVVILYTNDVHTYIDNPLSYDVIAGVKAELEQSYETVILVDAGDHVQGTAYGSMDKGETIIKLMNAASYDLATLGNHEFDYGMVAVLLTNCIEWLPLYFGILKTGALAVPVNYRFSADEIKYCLELSDSDMVVFGVEFISRMERISEAIKDKCAMIYLGDGDCPAFATAYETFVKDSSCTEPDIELRDKDHAAIYFSSGTTGFPKAILHDHESLLHAAFAEHEHHGQKYEDVFLCLPPLYHTGAIMHWFANLMEGGRSVLLRGVRADWILQVMSMERCTMTFLLVPWALDILNAVERGELKLADYELSQWRLMHSGAQPVPKSLIDNWLRLFPDHEYDTDYGLSEATGPGPVHLGVENTHKVGAIGKAGYGWQTRIVDEQMHDVAPGEIGELCLKGAGNMLCYYKDEEATAASLKDGWLLTGDMAKEDEDGFIYLVDRKKDVIITGGENIYPVQIENFLSAHPAIHDVAVIGLPDERLVEITAAIIQLKKGVECSKEEIDAFCQELPRYRRPRRIIFADVIRNATGKIDKPLLRKMYRP